MNQPGSLRIGNLKIEVKGEDPSGRVGEVTEPECNQGERTVPVVGKTQEGVDSWTDGSRTHEFIR